MTSNEGYLKPLLALSGNALFLKARKRLLQGLSTDELQGLIHEGVTECATRELQEALSVALLDLLMKKSVSVLEVAAMPDGPSNAANRARPEPTAASNHPNKRPDESNPTSSSPKKAKIETREIIEINGGEKMKLGNVNTQTAPNQSRQGKKGLAKARINMDKIVVKSTTIRVPDITIGLFAPTEVTELEHSCWRPLNSLDLDVATELTDKFVVGYTSTEIHLRRYEAMASDLEKYVELHGCVNDIIYFDGKIPKLLYDWDADSTDENFACKTCIRTNRLCVNLVDDDGEIIFCIFPLPKTHRQGKVWNDKAYWIFEDDLDHYE